MDNKRFTEILEAQIERSRNVLLEKAQEYATDTDRLANFKSAAAIQGVSVQEALAGMMAKHTYSVYELCKDGQGHTTAMWNEKITDHINYLLLLRAVVEEEHNTPEYDLSQITITKMPDDKDRVALDEIAKVLSDSSDWGSDEVYSIFDIVERVRTVTTD